MLSDKPTFPVADPAAKYWPEESDDREIQYRSGALDSVHELPWLLEM